MFPMLLLFVSLGSIALPVFASSPSLDQPGQLTIIPDNRHTLKRYTPADCKVRKGRAVIVDYHGAIPTVCLMGCSFAIEAKNIVYMRPNVYRATAVGSGASCKSS